LFIRLSSAPVTNTTSAPRPPGRQRRRASAQRVHHPRHPTVPDRVLVEIVDEVYLPLVRGRG
jgi:hypothetical protein